MNQAASPELLFRIWHGRRDPAEDLLTFLRLSHGEWVDLNWVRRKMAGPESFAIAALAYDQDQPAGIVAFGCIPFQSQQRCARWGVSFDTFVHPRYRGVGLFSLLLANAVNACRDEGISNFVNIPNDASRRGFEKQGWRPMPRARAYLNSRLAPPSALPRLLRFMRARSPFEPLGLPPIDPRLLADFSRMADRPSSYWSSAIGLNYLVDRLSPERGRGYAVVLDSDTGALLRIGNRGRVREAQILASSPRLPDSRSLRGIARLIRAEYAVDIITVVEGPPERHRDAVFGRAGFLPVPSNIRPYQLSPAPAKLLINGLDIHTW